MKEKLEKLIEKWDLIKSKTEGKEERNPYLVNFVNEIRLMDRFIRDLKSLNEAIVRKPDDDICKWPNCGCLEKCISCT